MEGVWLVIIGAIAGVLSGLVGVGGGIVIIPALLFFFHYSQKEAQGTTLALLIPPIGILAAYTYYKQGYVNVKAAGFMILGFVVGGLVGAKLAIHIPTESLTKLFGAFLLAVGVRLFFF